MDQHGVFTTAQASGLAVNGAALSLRIRDRRLFRLHRGVLSIVPPRLLTDRGRLLAAVLAGGPGAGLSHRTAAIHTGLVAGSPPRRLEITVPTQNGRLHPGLRIHRSTLLRPGDVDRVYGVPTTSVARTLLDLTGVLSSEQVEDALDEAGRLDLLVVADLREQATHNAARPEGARLARIIASWDHLNAVTESHLEKLLRGGLVAAGLLEPEPQQWLDLGDGGPPIRADFLYRDAWLILEADGWRWHAHRFERDRERDQRAAAAGFQTLRITRRQVVREMDRLTATVARVHAQRSRLSAP